MSAVKFSPTTIYTQLNTSTRHEGNCLKNVDSVGVDKVDWLTILQTFQQK